jgi:hypothetical protein
MEDDLAYFMGLSSLINNRLVQDLSQEESAHSDPSGKFREKRFPKIFKVAKIPEKILERAPEPEPKAATPEPEATPPEPDVAPPQLNFSKMHIPIQTATWIKKGKNKYQKLREAQYRDRLEAADPVSAIWKKVKAAAAGEKVEPTATQVKKTIKIEKHEKRKRSEQKEQKTIKDKRKAEKEAKPGFGRKKTFVKKGKRPNLQKKNQT